jgi:hypothetical protein
VLSTLGDHIVKLAFASVAGLNFEQRAALARALGANKALTKLGLSSVCWLGALRCVVYFRGELKPAQVARVTKLVRAAREELSASLITA